MASSYLAGHLLDDLDPSFVWLVEEARRSVAD